MVAHWRRRDHLESLSAIEILQYLQAKSGVKYLRGVL